MLKQRILSALVVLPLLLALIFLAPHLVFVAAVAAVVVLAAWEWAQFLGLSGPRRSVAGIAGGGLVLIAGWWLATQGLAHLPVLLAAGFWACSPVLLVLHPRSPPPWTKALIGLVVLLATFIALVGIHAAERGPELLLYLFLLVWAADVGAYFAGRALGRHKLAPSVSPGKTIEGAVGGALTVALVAAAGVYWFELPLAAGMATGLAVFVVSVLGDLVESSLKRQSGIKDSGNIMPGHGGVLDRLDSLLAAAPVFLLSLMATGAA